ncbi:hypothetical protein NP233_g10328 [Leucocoprinus birnbaumii]|uniref:Uncharacterized protein n=1 Tax=Leucocoprinus birnbaumii TaxID=56174 RepID=A0AAD5VJ66_9AGAR|nr:hypothetical protein NP233_g10328 [Leucocoprinus birnbaumii]
MMNLRTFPAQVTPSPLEAPMTMTDALLLASKRRKVGDKYLRSLPTSPTPICRTPQKRGKQTAMMSEAEPNGQQAPQPDPLNEGNAHDQSDQPHRDANMTNDENKVEIQLHPGEATQEGPAPLNFTPIAPPADGFLTIHGITKEILWMGTTAAMCQTFESHKGPKLLAVVSGDKPAVKPHLQMNLIKSVITAHLNIKNLSMVPGAPTNNALTNRKTCYTQLYFIYDITDAQHLLLLTKHIFTKSVSIFLYPADPRPGEYVLMLEGLLKDPRKEGVVEKVCDAVIQHL